MKRLAVVVLAVVLGAACGDTAGPTADPTVAQPSSSAAVTTVVPGTDAEQAASPLSGLASIDILTPRAGAGMRPRLEWSPVAGAVTYIATVSEPGAAAYWAWSGSETGVHLGGTQTPPPPESAGPTLHTPMELRVMALDGEDRIIGISDEVLLTP